MSALDEPVVAWTAALIDGEGSIMLNRMASGLKTGRGIRYRPVVVVACNTDYRLLEAIKERLEVGQIYEHRVANNPNGRSRQWTYRLNVSQIQLILPQVLPWLVIKREQADLLLEAMAIKAEITPGQPGFLPANRPALVEKLDAIYKEIRELNTRGRKKGGHQ